MTNMAFSKTIEPMRNFQKTVTRRYGWAGVKPAQIIQAVEKAQGIPKGEHVVPICEIQLLTPRWERADLMITDLEYGEREVILEGFPELSPKEFVEMLCEMNLRRPDELVHRLEFAYLIRYPYVTVGNCSIAPNCFEYQSDGTVAGFIRDDPNEMKMLENYRFDL